MTRTLFSKVYKERHYYQSKAPSLTYTRCYNYHLIPICTIPLNKCQGLLQATLSIKLFYHHHHVVLCPIDSSLNVSLFFIMS